VLTTIALVIGLAAVNILQPGRGMNVDLSDIDTSAVKPYIAQTQNQTGTEFVLNIIPQTMVGAFADGNVLQVLLVSVLFGFALTRLGEPGKSIAGMIEIVSRALFRVVGISDVGCATGRFRSDRVHCGQIWRGIAAVAGKIAGGFYLTCLVFVFGVLGPVCAWSGFSLLKLIRYIREETAHRLCHYVVGDRAATDNRTA